MEDESSWIGPRGRYDRSRYNPAARTVWPWPMLLLERVAEWVQALPGHRWLDGACGEGHFGELIGSRKTLIGLDVDPQRLLHATSRPYRLLLQGSLTAIPLADATLQGIASIETLEHIDDLDGALRECARCLGPRGHLVVTIPSVTLRSWWQMHRTKQAVYCDANEHVREFSSVAIKGFPHRFETWGDLRLRFRRQGFEVVKTGGVGFLLPMWQGRLAWVEHAMNLLYRERVNAWLGKLPAIHAFPYYRMYALQKGSGS
jgi:SAM-dependent methyltransferase